MNFGLPRRATAKVSSILRNLDHCFDSTTFATAPSLLTWFDVIGYTVLLEADTTDARYSEVILFERLRSALLKINLRVLNEAMFENKLLHTCTTEVIHQVTCINNSDLLSNNLHFHQLLTRGVDITYQCEELTVHKKIYLVDWCNLLNNDWLVVHPFTVVQNSNSNTHNLDVVVFINGLPLAVIVWIHPKDKNATLKAAYQRLQTYLQNIPQLFIYNTFAVIACGNRARVGTLTSQWQEFLPWRTIDGEDFPSTGETQLEVLIQGIFDKRRFLELVKYFIVFEENRNKIEKKFLRYPFCTVNTKF